MGYLYENSSPERFQQLCQSLLTETYPALQCYPVGQPDGGRDGWDPDSKTVLQVKYRRADEEDSADWMIAALEKEKSKVERLAERGATSYVMMTNARGTAHLDSGRIDRVQSWMDKNLPIPAQCFWRDEVDRRLDQSPAALKLKYSELITLEDGIDLVVQEVLGAGSEQRHNALRAFVASQFSLDKTVKFKQVSLSNELLDLFVDVPIGFPDNLLPKRSRSSANGHNMALMSALAADGLSVRVDQSLDMSEAMIYSDEEDDLQRSIGAARFLLGSGVQDHLKLIVLEGAPGQGKSTLAQFICQMHRARFLNRGTIWSQVADEYRNSTFRVPVKVDLRDFAAFLDGHSPFGAGKGGSETRSLENFLAQLISDGSGGIEFNAHDWLATVRKLPVLLFLDGLDEVPDMATRQQLVASIGVALDRWMEFNADLQVVVTSRPSLFGTAPSFEKLGFTTLQLRNIDYDRIFAYADKWIAANHLDSAESKDLVKILQEKLQLTHIRDLTRNPMQLTILLSLIHQVGHSLPDQRTDLYRRYLELFLTREADKSSRVREHQSILLGFIQHLAWELQRDAEASKSAGSISAEGLKSMARTYLRSGGHREDIAEDLFGGGLERIFVLVERIEGLYEFEVQPLREYFCAQHLYSTAPVGTYQNVELRGDRAQRFEALASNPFWLNVCRFYAGSCERSEKGTLVYSLKDMIKDNNPAVSVHARRVGISLLQDWVFSNSKRPQEDLVRSIFDNFGCRYLPAVDRPKDTLTLPEDCGQDILRDEIFGQLKEMPVSIEASQLCSVLRRNEGHRLTGNFLEVLDGLLNEERTSQLRRFFLAGGAHKLEPRFVWSLITRDAPKRSELRKRTATLFSSEPIIAESIPEAVKFYIEGVLNGEVVTGGFSTSGVQQFAYALGRAPGVFFSLRHIEGPSREGGNEEGVYSKLPVEIKEFLSTVAAGVSETGFSQFDFSENSEVYSMIAEAARQVFGENWAANSLAIRAAGISNTTAPRPAAKKLFDKEIPVYERARSARLRRGGTRWWLEQLADAENELDQRLWAGLVLTWASAENLMALNEQVSDIVDDLSEDNYVALRETIMMTVAKQGQRADRKRLDTVNLVPFSDRAAVLVALAFAADVDRLRTSPVQRKKDLIKEYIESRKQFETMVNTPTWRETDKALEWARKFHSLRSPIWGLPRQTFNHVYNAKMPLKAAQEIVRNCESYPVELLPRAVETVERHHNPRTLAKISSAQDWIFE